MPDKINTNRIKQIMLILLFVIYLIIILYLTVIRSGTGPYYESRMNLLPFADLIDVYKNAGTYTFLYLFLGNILCFVPFGFILTALIKKIKLPYVILSGFAFSLAIEVTQYVTRKGIAETDDILLNVLGVFVGWSIYKLIKRKDKEIQT